MTHDQVKNRIQIAKWHLERVREVLDEAQHHKTAYLVAKLEDELESLRKSYNPKIELCKE